MPKYSSYPFLYDEVQSLSIKDLNKLSYLKLGSTRSGTITWSCQGEQTASIGIKVDMRDFYYVEFDYKCNGSEYNYHVQLVSLPSNLGFGEVWYFLCRFTGKRCRKLHLISERFMHRSALPSGMYSKQTRSKQWRNMDKIFGNYFDNDELYRELYSKNFKKFYKGKPTKRYMKLMNKIKASERFTASEIESLLLIGI